MTAILSNILDILVLVFLGVTIFYAYRLSKALSNFKSYRQEMNALIKDLSKNINHAQKAMDGMKSTAVQSGNRLQEKINDAASLYDEMRMMIDLGENLAKRLERSGGEKSAAKVPSAKAVRAKPAEEDIPSFFIQDREYAQDNEKLARDDDAADDADLEIPANLQSEAERELYKALHRNKG